MSEYGLTNSGPNIKRLDVILEEMHTDLTERLGVNTRQKPESVINHLLTNVADRIAELWELGESIYYSQYPSSAEGVSLDYAAQYGGTARESAAKSYYPIHCTGLDGTTLEAGTMIASSTNPVTYLTLITESEITRSSFNKAVIKVAAVEDDSEYKIYLNDNVYAFTSSSGADELTILNGLQELISANTSFSSSVDETELTLSINSTDETINNVLILSENLTTETVTTILTFGTVETGDIYLPIGVINVVVKADAGLLEVTNICSYIAGQDDETDTEFRQSYINKIFNRASTTLESIRSAILQNVQGVTSVAVYENASNETDSEGRPPHSIEIVVDGGDSTEIAQQILEKKPCGISTYGDIEVTLIGTSDEEIVIRFNKPTVLYVWFKLNVTLKNNDIPSDYDDILKSVIIENVEALSVGDDIVPQEFVSELITSCSGISYIDISVAEGTGKEKDDEPSDNDYVRIIETSERQRIYVDENMIEVNLT